MSKQCSIGEGCWSVVFISSRVEKKIKKFCAKNKVYKRRWETFKKVIVVSPYHNSVPKTIAKLKSKEPQSNRYRYRNDPVRIIYFVVDSTKQVFPIEINRADDVSYKKRSKR